MKEFQAYSPNHGSVVGESPRKAAEEFFMRFPNSRKCNIIEGVSDGGFFTVTYSRGSLHYSLKNVSKKQALDLPDTPARLA